VVENVAFDFNRTCTPEQLTVKHTFLTTEDETEERPVRPTKSVPFSFRLQTDSGDLEPLAPLPQAGLARSRACTDGATELTEAAAAFSEGATTADVAILPSVSSAGPLEESQRHFERHTEQHLQPPQLRQSQVQASPGGSSGSGSMQTSHAHGRQAAMGSNQKPVVRICEGVPEGSNVTKEPKRKTSAAASIEPLHIDTATLFSRVSTPELMVKNTFLTIDTSDEEDGCPVRPTKSVPLSFKPRLDGASILAQKSQEADTRSSQPQFVSRSRAHTEGALPSSGLPLSSFLLACQAASGSQGRFAGNPQVPAMVHPSVALVAGQDAVAPARRVSLSGAQAGIPAAIRQAHQAMVAGHGVLPAASAAHHSFVPVALRGRVWRLSQDGHGCHIVQEALDKAENDEVRQAIAQELTGHVWDATTSPHGNFVVQKCVTALPASALGFIINELCSKSIVHVAKNKFGCRVVNRLIEKCPSAQVCDIVEAILASATEVARHPYGNYVVQHLLLHADARQKRRLVMSLVSEIKGLAVDIYGCAVVSTGLSMGAEDYRSIFARAVLCEPGLLVQIACTRHGHVAAARVLHVLRGAERDEARRLLSERIEALRASRFGRIVASNL